MSSYFVSAAESRAEYEANKEFYDNFTEGFLKTLDMDDSELLARQYRLYGVDNEFDLVEAMYNASRGTTWNVLGQPWFNELRRRCIENPEYTERCLKSPAFWNMRDEILKRIGDA